MEALRTATFNMNGFNILDARTIYISGTEGVIWGDMMKRGYSGSTMARSGKR